MGMREDVRRYRDSGLNAEYHWLSGADALALRPLLDEIEKDPQNLRLCFRPGLDDAGVVTFWFYVGRPANAGVVQLEGENCGPANRSHPCPPLC